MFQTINGVQSKEYDETKALPNILDERFVIDLQKMVCLDLINIYVKGRGKIKDTMVDTGCSLLRILISL